ncbi:YpeB-like protein with putative protease inhibitory function [Luteimonas sp. J16]|uniref:PepSY domain-containing protein n=1 Tax=unclassified Luteimonas TaxID=2629088 RepID=UPI0004B20809|nr:MULTISPECIES: PepSY domain-containing protein [unclassified Luteimonas]TWG89074.1 YpeB-like protein with putative protease inhibitory function [Luteimonas sp. J16]
MRRPIRFRKAWLAMAVAAAAGTALAQDADKALTGAEVRAKIEAEGYTNVHDVEFDDGVWTADARSADGRSVDLSIDPRTGKVYPDHQVSRLGKDDIEARLATAGYGDVHDVEFDDGVWKAEARDASGRKVELRLDPEDGRVIGEHRD